jgi:uncharacterized protein (DUF2147 family)
MRLSTPLTAALAALALSAGAAYAQKADDAYGVWLNPENGTNIEMYKCAPGICAKIVANKDGQKTDDKNPDAAKRSQPIVGLVIMADGKKSGDAAWNGSLYNRDNGKTYSGTITVKSKDAIELSGCVAAVLCRSATWTRVK